MKYLILALLLSACGKDQSRPIYYEGPCPCKNQQACEYWPWPVGSEPPVLCILE